MKKTGTIYVIAAASGTGKTSLVEMLTESLDDIIVSISYTTRPQRPGEQNGEHYFFIDEKQFQEMIDKRDFLEYAQVFNHHYGTSLSWVNEKLENGIDVILEIDWQGAHQVKELIPNCVSIFILPPSIAELRERLIKRNQDKPEVITQRLSAANAEISHCNEFDYIVVNDKFDVALVDLRSIIRARRLLRENQLHKQKQLLAELTQTR